MTLPQRFNFTLVNCVDDAAKAAALVDKYVCTQKSVFSDKPVLHNKASTAFDDMNHKEDVGFMGTSHVSGQNDGLTVKTPSE